MEKELIATETTERGLPALSPKEVVEQVRLVQQIMKTVMKKGVHYDILPGTPKPCLLKPGAEILCFTFRLAPNYEILMEEHKDDYISYTVKCTLTSIISGRVVATGIGSCNSREDKYLYKYEHIPTGASVPQEYWKTRDPSLLGGEDHKPKKINGRWVICKVQKIKNENPYNLDNTYLKMAEKRAFTWATLNGTAASDIFTHDMEDSINGEEFEKASEDEPIETYNNEVKKTEEIKKTEEFEKTFDITDNSRRRQVVYGLLNKLKTFSDQYSDKWWRDYLQKEFNVTSTKSLNTKQLQEVIAYLANMLNLKMKKEV